MAKADLTAERLRKVLHYEPITGTFTRLSSRTTGAKFGPVRTRPHHKGYIYLRVDGCKYSAHHLAWLAMTGKWPLDQIDRWDTDRSNNAWSNLREAGSLLNSQNRRISRKDNKLGILGVSKTSAGKFTSEIQANKIRHWLGLFDTAELAHEAYVKAKRELHIGNTL